MSNLSHDSIFFSFGFDSDQMLRSDNRFTFDTILGSALPFQKCLISPLHSSIIPAFVHLLLYTLSIWLAVGPLSLWKLTKQKSGGKRLLTRHIFLQTPFPSSSSVPFSSFLHLFIMCPYCIRKSEHHIEHERMPHFIKHNLHSLF